MDYIRPHLSSFILAVVIVTLPIIPSTSPGLVLYGYGQILCTLYPLIILSIILLVYGFGKKQKWIAKISYVDIILAIYLAAGLFNILCIQKLQIDPVWLFRYGTLTLVYMIARSLNSHTIIYNAVILSGCVQSFITFFQYFGMVTSRNGLFPVTGTFDNPGPLGGYLSLCLIISTLLLTGVLKQKQYPKVLLYFSAVALIGTAMIVTSSRAAWLSVGIAFFYFLYTRLCVRMKPICNKLLILTAFVGMMSGCKLLYEMQPGSVKARLLIWHVSATMFADNPFSGHGIGAFSEKYMIYQAKYFENNPESSFSRIADNPLYAYNEFINVGVEQGIIGLLIVFALIFTVFFSKHARHSGSTIPQTVLLGWLVFCFFSYPSDIFPVLMLLPLLMAFVDSTVAAQINIHTKTIVRCVCILMGLLAITILFNYRACNLSTIMISASENKRNRQISDTDLSLFIHNRRIKTILPVYAGTNDERLHKRIQEVADSYDSFMYLAELSMYKTAYKESEHYYRTASYMIPNRMRPNYCLWQLAVKSNDMEKAVYYAKKIIKQQVKISNTFTIRTKSQMIQFLKESEITP